MARFCSFCNLSVNSFLGNSLLGFLHVWPTVLSLNNLTIHKTKEVKSICIQEKNIILLTIKKKCDLKDTGLRIPFTSVN